LSGGIQHAINNIDSLIANLVDKDHDAEKVLQWVDNEIKVCNNNELNVCYAWMLKQAEEFTKLSKDFNVNPYQCYVAAKGVTSA
jgi:hypothetical protein